MNKKIWWALALATALTGCSSVSLQEGQVPVEDRTGTATGADAAARTDASAEARAATQSRVASVAADNSAVLAAGPAGVGRLIYFDYDSVAIKPEFQSVIEKHAAYIKQDSKRRIAIEGHTDERGGREYNLALGQKRSEAVRKALNLLGVSDGQIEAVSLGKEKPAMTGSTEEAFAKNRRAEIAYK